jgi:hypothetical protein
MMLRKDELILSERDFSADLSDTQEKTVNAKSFNPALYFPQPE